MSNEFYRDVFDQGRIVSPTQTPGTVRVYIDGSYVGQAPVSEKLLFDTRIGYTPVHNFRPHAT